MGPDRDLDTAKAEFKAAWKELKAKPRRTSSRRLTGT